MWKCALCALSRAHVASEKVDVSSPERNIFFDISKTTRKWIKYPRWKMKFTKIERKERNKKIGPECAQSRLRSKTAHSSSPRSLGCSRCTTPAKSSAVQLGVNVWNFARGNQSYFPVFPFPASAESLLFRHLFLFSSCGSTHANLTVQLFPVSLFDLF